MDMERIIDEMMEHLDDMTDVDKKLLMNLLLEKVENSLSKDENVENVALILKINKSRDFDKYAVISIINTSEYSNYKYGLV